METNTFQGADIPSQYVPTSDEKTLAILAHILTLAVSNFAPLIIYFLKKDESAFVSHHAKESLNFQITLLIVVIGLFITVVGILLL